MKDDRSGACALLFLGRIFSFEWSTPKPQKTTLASIPANYNRTAAMYRDESRLQHNVIG
jgi:hypothetical protein